MGEKDEHELRKYMRVGHGWHPPPRLSSGWRRIAKSLVIRGLVLFFIASQYGTFITLLFPETAHAAALTVASAISETQQTTVSTTYTASDVSIAAGSLPAGTYFVSWGAAVANSAATNVSNARLVRGATEVAALSHASIAATAANMGIARSGYWLGTLSGSEALTIQYSGSAGTTYIDSKFIKAIRLDTDLTADADYFTSGSQEAATDEVANAAVGSWTDIKTLTKTFSNSADIEDYLVFASMEISPDTAPNDCFGRIEIDGTGIMTSVLEGKNVADQQGYAVAKLSSIGTGSKSIKLQGQSAGTATCDYRRSRIHVFRASVFDQALENYSAGESTLATTTWTDKNTQTYTPNQSETVMVIGSRMQGTGTATCSMATRYDDGTTQYVDTHAFAAVNGAADYAIGMSAASLTVSSAKTFKTQFQRTSSTCTVKIKESTLIIWSMTLRDAAAYNQSAYRWFNNTTGTGASGIWWDGAWKNRRKITFNNSQSSENLTNFTVRVSLNGSGASRNIDYGKTQNAGQDIRFVDTNGTTVLKHEIEKWNETGTSEVWVNVPQIDIASTTDFVWMYYNNTAASDAQDVANTWNTGYKGVWHLDENPAGSAPQMLDSTSSAYNGTTANMEAGDQVSGVIDGSVGLDGVNESIDVGHQTNLYSATSYTVSCWVQPTTPLPSERHFFSDYNSGTTHASFDMYLSTARLPVFLSNNNGVVAGAVGTFAADIGQWYYITGVWSGSNTATLYINGQSNATGSAAGAMPAFANVGNATIGKAGSSAGTPFPGGIDECRYSSTNRSAEWIEADYKTQNNQMNTFGAEEANTDYVPLAAANSAHTLSSTGQAFRLRMLLHVANNDLPTGAVDFKLQYAQRSGTCDTGYSGETYEDVGTVSGAIRYKDNAGETDGVNLLNDADDPTHSGHTVTSQTYDEANNFTSTSRITKGGDGKWEFALVDDSAPGGTSYCFRIVRSDGSAIAAPEVVPEITTANAPPSIPASLAQKKTDDTVLTTGAWTNETSVTFTATVSDPGASDTLQLCVEKDLLGTDFSNTEDSCGTGVAYTGSGVPATVTISGLSDASQYHWQARVKDADGLYSSWVSYDVNVEAARDFGTDTTAPTGGVVYDGTATSVDKAFSDTSLSSLSANWSGFNADVSGLVRYDYSIGTTIGGTDTKGWTSNGTTTSITATGLTLQTSEVYYFNVRAVDNAGNAVIRSSNGQLVAPSVSFSVAPATITFNDLGPSNAHTDTKTTTVTTSTNAYGGYVIRAFATDLLRSPGNFTVGNFNGGTYTSPDSWQPGDTGLGYTSSDTSVQGSDKFQSDPCLGGSALVSPGCYAPFTLTKPGDIIADHVSNVSGSPIINESFAITLRATTTAQQQATRYQTTLVYAITPVY